MNDSMTGPEANSFGTEADVPAESETAAWPGTAAGPEPELPAGPWAGPAARQAAGPDAGPDAGPEADAAAGPTYDATAGSTYDPAAPAPLNVPRTPTGNGEVDAQLDRLADADHLAADGHVEVYEDVHRGLRDTLTALDARPGPTGPPRPPGMASPHSMNHRT